MKWPTERAIKRLLRAKQQHRKRTVRQARQKGPPWRAVYDRGLGIGAIPEGLK